MCGGTPCGNCKGVKLLKGNGIKTITDNEDGTFTILLDNGDTFTTSDFTGPAGADGDDGTDGQGIDHISLTTDGPTKIYTVWGDVGETIDLGTFEVTDGVDGIDGVDANSNYQNVLWIDTDNGNDGTALVGRFDLPYLTYTAARTASTAGDLIWFRKGSYTTTLTLKDGVDVHFDTGSILNGYITDNAVAATCKVFGEFNIVHGSNNAISVTATGSDVTVSFDTISCVGTVAQCRPGAGNTSRLNVKGRRIKDTTINYFVTVSGTSIVNVEIMESCKNGIDVNSSGFSGIHLRDFNGSVNVKIGSVTLSDSTTSSLAGFLIVEEDSCTGGTSIIEIDEVINNYNYILPNDKGMISKEGNGKMFVNIKKSTSIKRACITNTGTNADSFLFVKGRFYCKEDAIVRNDGTGKLIIKDSSLHRGDEGDDLNQVVVLGYVPSASYPFSSNEENYTEIINTSIIKTSAGTDTTGALIARGDGADIKILLRDSIFITKGTFTGEVASAETTSTPDNDFYFNNCRSNNPTLPVADITQKQVAGGVGIIVNDVYLDTFDYID